ncbi:MAG: glycosyltransferase family 9 protein [Candidatus Omnitrophota bacterium]
MYRNILVIRTDRFGEFILTLPAIHALKDKFSSASITLLANPYSAQVVDTSPDIDKVIEYDEEKFKNFFQIFRFARRLKLERFDLSIIFNPRKEFNLLTFLAGIPLRLGYERKWGFLLNKHIKDLKFQGQKHEVEYNFDLIKAIGIEKSDSVFNISSDESDQETVDKILSEHSFMSFCALHPWTSNIAKQWPIEHFLELAKRLIYEFGQNIVLIGGSGESGQAELFIEKLESKILNLTGKLSLRECVALLKKASFLVSNDSGPVHIAAAVNTPVIALFRAGIAGVCARRWGPYGQGHIVIERERISDIAVGEVLEAVKKILA